MRYNLSRVTAPTESLLTLAEARLQLRVDTFGSPASNPEDDLIQSYIDAVTQDIDAGSGWLGRALAPQSWKLALDDWPTRCIGNIANAIVLPYPPLISVTSFTYVDGTGATQTLTEGTGFRVIKETGVDAGQAYLAPLYGETWPAVRVDADAINITYQCGYGSGSPLTEDVPAIIKNYVRAAITFLYESRGVVGRGNDIDMPDHIRNMLHNLRVWSAAP